MARSCLKKSKSKHTAKVKLQPDNTVFELRVDLIKPSFELGLLILAAIIVYTPGVLGLGVRNELNYQSADHFHA
jgi:multisubunit Na+/H+ antiporter MnhE subunit